MRKGFSLVEMLIVVVIIGILAAAILPRVTGYLAKTRDLKRQMDLRNIAAAIERYKDDHGEFPKGTPTEEISHWYANSGLRKSFFDPDVQLKSPVTRLLSLKEYISILPKDPNHQHQVKIYSAFHQTQDTKQYGPWRTRGQLTTPPGEYIYQWMYSHGSSLSGGAFLVAKMETPEMSNYVFDVRAIPILWTVWGNTFPTPSYYVYNNTAQKTQAEKAAIYNLQKIKLCSSIIKGEISQRANRENDICTYSNQDQLYYIIKIE